MVSILRLLQQVIHKGVATLIPSPQQASPPLVTVSADSELYSMVKGKMKEMENEAALARIHTLEKLVMHLTHEMMKQQETLNTCRELLLHVATTNDELLHTVSESADELVVEGDEEDTSAEELLALPSKPVNKKLGIN